MDAQYRRGHITDITQKIKKYDMIRNVLFDLGGVIMDIDRSRCVEAFKALGFADVEDFLGDYAQKGSFADLESGRIDAAEFRRRIRPCLPEGTGDRAIDRAFCEFLIGIPLRRLVALRELRRLGLGVYMLSNTNPIMWNSKIAEEFGQEGLRREDYFDGIVTSFEARVMKPAPEIFAYAAERLGIEPSETIFLDDGEANVRAAEAAGWHAALVPPGVEFDALLRQSGIIK